MKLYEITLREVRYAKVLVVAESRDEAEETALDEALCMDFETEDPAEVDDVEEVDPHYVDNERRRLPVFASAEALDEYPDLAGPEPTAEAWCEALIGDLPIVDDRTLPLALPYPSGTVERVKAVAQRHEPGGAP